MAYVHGGSHRNTSATETIKSLMEGQLPSTRLLTRAIDNANHCIEDRISEGRFSYEGEEVVRDTQAVLADIRLLLTEKNRGEKLQRLLYHAKLLGESTGPSRGGRRVSYAGQKLGQDARDSIVAVKDLSLALINSSQFRDILVDTLDLAKDIFVANVEEMNVKRMKSKTPSEPQQEGFLGPKPGVDQNVGEEERGEEEQPPQKPREVRVYHSQEPYTFVGEVTDGEQETELMENLEDETDRQQRPRRRAYGEGDVDQEDQIYGEYDYVKDRYLNDDNHFEFDEPSQPSGGLMQAVIPGGPSGVMNKVVGRITKPFREAYGVEGKRNIKENLIIFKDTVTKISSDMAKGTNVVKLSEEQKDKIFDRMRDLLLVTSDNPSFRRAMKAIIHLLGDFKGEASQAGYSAYAGGSRLYQNIHYQNMMSEFRAILEEFTGAGTVTRFMFSLNQLRDRVNKDKSAQGWLRQMRRYLTVSMERPRLLDESMHRERGKALITRGREIVQAYGYEQTTKNFFKESTNLLRSFLNDPIARKTGYDIQRLINDLTLDRTGRFRIKTEILMELKDLIVPLIVDQLDSIPVPTIESHTESMDFWADNIVFSGRDIIPDQITFETDNAIDIRPRERLQPFTEYRREAKGPLLIIRAKDIHCHANGIQFWFRRNKAPRREDGGIADLDVGGNGMEIEIRLRMYNPATPPLFSVESVKVFISEMRVRVRDTKSDWLYNMAIKLFNKTIRTAIQKTAEAKIKDALLEFDLRLSDLVYRMLPKSLPSAPRRLPPKRLVLNPDQYAEYDVSDVRPYRNPTPPRTGIRYDTFESYDPSVLAQEGAEGRPFTGEFGPRISQYGFRGSARRNREQEAIENVRRSQGYLTPKHEDYIRRWYGVEGEARRPKSRTSTRDLWDRVELEKDVRYADRHAGERGRVFAKRDQYTAGDRPSFHDHREVLHRYPVLNA